MKYYMKTYDEKNTKKQLVYFAEISTLLVLPCSVISKRTATARYTNLKVSAVTFLQTIFFLLLELKAQKRVA